MTRRAYIPRASRRGSPVRAGLGALILIMAGLALNSCSPETRYEVLTFFFTGVPPPGEDEKPVEAAQASAGGLAAARERQAKFKEARMVHLRRPLAWIHGPFAANECSKCHALGASKKFTAAFGDSGVGAIGGGVGPRLVMPIEELCISCHSEKGTETADKRGLRLHAPVASGFCVGCHSPHQSQRQFMLLAADNVGLCAQCHDATELRDRSARHRKEGDGGKIADCLECHNPHEGRTAMILRSEHDELWAR